MLCAEIIFGTGDKLRSGEACGPDTLEEPWELGRAQMCPFGLSQFNENRLISGAQGTIGIITWATLKCRYFSKLSRTFLIPSETMEPLIDLSYQLLRIRLGDNLLILNGLNLACLLGQKPKEIEQLRAILPPWVLIVTFEGYGELPEEKVQYQEADFKDIAQSCHLGPMAAIPGANAEDVHELFTRPSVEPYWKLRLRVGCQDIFFLTTLDKASGFVAAISTLAQSRRYPTENIGVYIQPTVQGTSCHCEFNLYYDPSQSTEVDRVKWLVAEGSEELAKMGGFFSRPYGAWASFAYGCAAETVIMQRKTKEIFDPNWILNPGKLCF
jgi:FAD/FMN-containing dehydrogenase